MVYAAILSGLAMRLRITAHSASSALCGAPHNAEFERAMIRERTSAGIAAARAEGRVGGRRKKLDAAKRREIAESVITGRKSGAEMARLYNISQPTVSRIVAQHRMVST
jgi:DNA invertase Pin-like site-specific DNA recombinase